MDNPTTQTNVLPYRTARRPNPRMLLVLLVLVLPLGYMVYTFVNLSIHNGIEQVGAYKQVDLKSMGNFPFDEIAGSEKDVPEVYRNLDGQKVLLVGQMYSGTSAGDRVPEFQLVYSIAKCCFGGPPRVQERVFAHAPQGRTVPLYDGLAKIYGTLHVRTDKAGGKIISLYDLDVEKVEAM